MDGKNLQNKQERAYANLGLYALFGLIGFAILMARRGLLSSETLFFGILGGATFLMGMGSGRIDPLHGASGVPYDFVNTYIDLHIREVAREAGGEKADGLLPHFFVFIVILLFGASVGAWIAGLPSALEGALWGSLSLLTVYVLWSTLEGFLWGTAGSALVGGLCGAILGATLGIAIAHQTASTLSIKLFMASLPAIALAIILGDFAKKNTEKMLEKLKEWERLMKSQEKQEPWEKEGKERSKE